MSENNEISTEERVLLMMKRILTDVAKETFTKPGYTHPLSDNTIQGIRECLALISAREAELREGDGRGSNLRPRYIDEPRKTVVVPIDSLKSNKGDQGAE